ncbi:MAG: helix-turn-helix domain-containing protein [Clostridia bacterium]|nr:helix-turn-helix domain-containing protein [Clostridia bacterium]
MTPIEKEIILTFAKNDMNLTRTAKELFRSKNSVLYWLVKIKSEYGLDPRCFYDLITLVARLSKENEEMSAQIFYCAGVDISQQTADTIAEHLYKAGYRKI